MKVIRQYGVSDNMKDFDCVILTKDYKNLKSGDMGTIVMVHTKPSGYEVEFFSASGTTIAVESLDPEMIRPLKESDILHVRSA